MLHAFKFFQHRNVLTIAVADALDNAIHWMNRFVTKTGVLYRDFHHLRSPHVKIIIIFHACWRSPISWAYSWDIELNTRREIPYLRPLMYYSLYQLGSSIGLGSSYPLDNMSYPLNSTIYPLTNCDVMFDFPCPGESYDYQQTRKWCGRESLGNKRNEARPADRERL